MFRSLFRKRDKDAERLELDISHIVREGLETISRRGTSNVSEQTPPTQHRLEELFISALDTSAVFTAFVFSSIPDTGSIVLSLYPEEASTQAAVDTLVHISLSRFDKNIVLCVRDESRQADDDTRAAIEAAIANLAMVDLIKRVVTEIAGNVSSDVFPPQDPHPRDAVAVLLGAQA